LSIKSDLLHLSEREEERRKRKELIIVMVAIGILSFSGHVYFTKEYITLDSIEKKISI
jgi:hypothetical protein